MKQLNEVAKKLNKLAQLNIFENTRKAEHIEARSLFCLIAYKYFSYNLIQISKYMKQNGKSSDHSTILHALKNYEMYSKYKPNLNVWLEEIVGDLSSLELQQKKQLIIHKVGQLSEKNVDELNEHLEEIYNNNILENETAEN